MTKELLCMLGFSVKVNYSVSTCTVCVGTCDSDVPVCEMKKKIQKEMFLRKTLCPKIDAVSEEK